MMNKKANSAFEQVNSQELQHLITVSTGFIDAYIISCHDKEAMLLPQNIVLSALDSTSEVDKVEWHDVKLPVYSVCHPGNAFGVALVIEGDSVEQRFALMCNEMPQSIRLRISEVVDDHRQITDQSIAYYVLIGSTSYYVPNLEYIQREIGVIV